MHPTGSFPALAELQLHGLIIPVHFKTEKMNRIGQKRGEGTVRTHSLAKGGLCSFTVELLTATLHQECFWLFHSPSYLYSQCSLGRKHSVDYIKCDADQMSVPLGQYN